MTEDRKWITEPIEKFGDVRSVEERRFRRNLPPTYGMYGPRPTPDLETRREVESRFRIKRTG